VKKNRKIFEDLFVLDLANNHFGDINHAKKIISKFAQIKKAYKIKATIKFQFRDLKSFIHPSEIDNKENKYVSRFLSTKLSDRDFNNILKYVKKNNFLTSCTPFDEISVKKVKKMKFDILKIASVSSLDWNLLEEASKTGLPMIVSTGGRTLEEIDKIVSFLEHRNNNFALMHCISIYPSKNKDLQLKFIKTMVDRYKPIPIGWSTHEEPENFIPATISLSLGAKIFEKHVGINSKKYPLNRYSITPELFKKYLDNLNEIKHTLGNSEKKINKKEKETLDLLQRGIYAKKNIKRGEMLNISNIYAAFPLKKNQISSSGFSLKSNNYTALEDIKAKQEIKVKNIKQTFSKKLLLITSYLHKVKAMLKLNNINLGKKFDLEISHHYGLNNFEKYGCFLFNCINREYAKKIIVLLPNQKHPLHRHKKKEETFHILYGKLSSSLNGKTKILKEGDQVLVKPLVWHKFQTNQNGCIFEEVSTTSYKDDSFYKDKSIQKLPRNDRKSYIKNWHEFESRKKYYDKLNNI